ncbi:MAG: hypothetical protein AB7H96_20355 [Vicinamibacterales bacterium]
MSTVRLPLASLLGACLALYPVAVHAQHAKEPAAHGEAARHAEPAKHESTPDAKTAPARESTKPAPATHGDTAAHTAAAPAKAAATPAPAAHGAKKGEHGPAPADKSAKAEPAAHGASTAQARKTPSHAPQVVVKKVDTVTGQPAGSAPKGGPDSSLHAAIERISERIDEVRASGDAGRAAPGRNSAPRIKLTWRTTLDWPMEIAESSDAQTEETSAADEHAAPTLE